jgi:hypothetical protein
VILDAQFFHKLRWFAQEFGEHRLLQPNRYWISRTGWKQYIEVIDPIESSPFRNTPPLERNLMGVSLRFRRPQNPHSGCFFLTVAQMERWSKRPYFLDRSDEWVGPLESAATLGIFRSFAIYKPDETNAAFLELFDGGAASRPVGQHRFDPD